MKPRWLAVLAVLVVAAWLATGLFTVRTGQHAVVLTFGAAGAAINQPGLHWHWPPPVGTVAVVNAARVRTN